MEKDTASVSRPNTIFPFHFLPRELKDQVSAYVLYVEQFEKYKASRNIWEICTSDDEGLTYHGCWPNAIKDCSFLKTPCLEPFGASKSFFAEAVLSISKVALVEIQPSISCWRQYDNVEKELRYSTSRQDWAATTVIRMFLGIPSLRIIFEKGAYESSILKRTFPQVQKILYLHRSSLVISRFGSSFWMSERVSLGMIRKRSHLRLLRYCFGDGLGLEVTTALPEPIMNHILRTRFEDDFDDCVSKEAAVLDHSAGELAVVIASQGIESCMEADERDTDYKWLQLNIDLETRMIVSFRKLLLAGAREEFKKCW